MFIKISEKQKTYIYKFKQNYLETIPYKATVPLCDSQSDSLTISLRFEKKKIF
jgi:hypothetical protein